MSLPAKKNLFRVSSSPDGTYLSQVGTPNVPSRTGFAPVPPRGAALRNQIDGRVSQQQPGKMNLRTRSRPVGEERFGGAQVCVSHKPSLDDWMDSFDEETFRVRGASSLTLSCNQAKKSYEILYE